MTSAPWICSGKTGTLTEARIALVGSFGPDGADSRFIGGLRSNLDDAILAGYAPDADPCWTCIDDVPLDY